MYPAEKIQVFEYFRGRNARHFRGRNAQYWSVNFTGDKKEISLGDMVRVVVEKLSGHSLRGKAVSVNRSGKKIPNGIRNTGICQVTSF